MPLYEYHCASCGPFAQFRSMDERNHPVACPECQGSSPRAFAVPNLGLIPASIRQAHARNEKSCHEPSIHHRGCSGHDHCGKSKARPKTNKRVSPFGDRELVQTTRRGNRPWMLGH